MDQHTELLIEEAAQILKIAGANEVFIFGSATKGTLTDSSDIDMAVSGLPPKVFFRTMGQSRSNHRRICTFIWRNHSHNRPIDHQLSTRTHIMVRPHIE